jgi:hypothetical protein
MIQGMRTVFDRLLGRGSAAVTVPVFDGVLKPNHLLDEAEEWLGLDSPGDLAALGDKLYVSDGNCLLTIEAQGQRTEVLRTNGQITAFAPWQGGFALAVDGTRIDVVGGAHDGRSWHEAAGVPFGAINAITVQDDALIATDGSRHHGPEQWQRDLMEKRANGRVVKLTADGATVLRSGLGYAFGVVAGDGDLWVSESWRHRLIRLGDSSSVLDNLPGYPSRLTQAKGSGYWLSVFACRTQLVEFVLREKDFREEMMRSISPELWVAPQVRPPASFLEPLQGGAIKQMGVLKPWAPPRSYGLVIRLSESGHPLTSLHSRVDGRHHGITAVAETADALFILSLGVNAVLRLPLHKIAEGAQA